MCKTEANFLPSEKRPKGAGLEIMETIIVAEMIIIIVIIILIINICRCACNVTAIRQSNRVGPAALFPFVG